MAEETPLISQYKSIKEQHPDEVLFFRLGDFYEMFFDDAVEVSRLLNLTLTQRCGNPMCGIPYHASKIYIARLLRLGKKIAIAEQVGEIGKGKGIVERKIVEIITPGTAVESEYIDSGINNFLASFSIVEGNVGFSFIDVTTGEFKATSFSENTLQENLSKELGRVNPREVLIPDNLRTNQVVKDCLALHPNCSVSYYPSWNFNCEVAYKKLCKQFNTVNLRGFNLLENSCELPSSGFLLDYVEKTTGSVSSHISSIQIYKDNQYVVMDDSSRRNLELIYNLRDGTSNFTLLDCVNYTKTSMGSRLIREWLNFPLLDKQQIVSRQNHVELFVDDRTLLHKIRECLSCILDVERLAGRIAMEKAHGKDLQALRLSLESYLKIVEILKEKEITFANTQTALDLIGLIQASILEDPATSLTEGRIIKKGWSEELDKWRDIQDNFNKILDDYAEEERIKTGISNLRIKNNGNMGYFIEITKGKIDKVPEHFMMRRALVNADRFTTEKLQDLEEKLNESGTKVIELERDLFIEIRSKVKEQVAYLLQVARELSYIDVTHSFAQAAIYNDWVRPVITEDNVFEVENGRHPVVEKNLPKGEFVPNSLYLLNDGIKSFGLITGPNMAGKSTFLRQNALIALLAQTGSFVPCDRATLGVVDQIFCRVGASDNLARGESTFLVEMTETAHILRSATEKSLVIMDEVGRGTSTEDGLSIAWAISEYLLNRIKCKTLFATHYHELTRLEHNAIIKLCMAVDESNETVVFLRKVIEGSTQNSYGIHVASLAGVPQVVIDRANVLLSKIQEDAHNRPLLTDTEIVTIDRSEVTSKIESSPKTEQKAPKVQTSLTGALFSDEELILDEILSLNIDNLTGIDALQTLSRWKKTLMGN